MKSILSKIAIFAVGAAIGSAVTWKLLETRYEARIEEETESIRESLTRKYKMDSEDESEEESEEDDSDDEDDTVYESSLELYGGSAEEGKKKLDEYNDESKPYVISPGDYGMLDGYGMASLVYYADGILADDLSDEIIKDIDSTVGLDSLEAFGEYEENVVYVRNDELHTDFEIMRDVRGYSEVVEVEDDE